MAVGRDKEEIIMLVLMLFSSCAGLRKHPIFQVNGA